MDDWQHRSFDPPGGSRDHGQWQVHLSISPSDADAIRRFGSQTVPTENFEIHTEVGTAGEEGEVIFAIRVVTDNAADAVVEASYKLNKIRTAAGLPTRAPEVLGYISASWRQDPARHIGREAVELLKQGRDALAVIRAQTACELLIAKTLEGLLAEQSPDVRADQLIRRPATLADPASQALCHLLTGRRVQDERWWPEYVAHRKRRNAIVHAGVTISHEDAQASIQATNAVHSWLLEVRGVELTDEESSE
ncbi:MAG TPA: hypothetical protein VH299_08050 [Solirubrobacterales bacterium]|jgi:hypothetical protein|nr:hypothetical protein [Solirubrobacterales bacterium]